jgi:hypothetical protein
MMMSRPRHSTRTLLAAAMAAALAATPAIAADQVNVSGASLFWDFFTKPASTNDFIDVDGNTVSGFNGGFPQNLAPSASGYNPIVDAPNTVWYFNYRGVGSGNGLAEFVNHQLDGTIPTSITTEGGVYNGYVYNTVGGTNTSPNTQTSIDIAVMDVPTKWFVTVSGTPSWNANPTTAGYGSNPAVSYVGNVSNKLKTLSNPSKTKTLNTNTGSPDANTVFDNEIAWVPVAFVANRGADVENIDMSDLQYLNVTGRDSNGINFVVATRDSGSGTRNAAMNSIGVDPSWGVGDNNGAKNSADANTQLGSTFAPDNQGGSGLMENVVQNSRIAIGYTGLLGSSRAMGDANSERYEVLNVRKDVENGVATGATEYVRPTDITVVTQNGDINTGWQIGGPETMATLGDVYETNTAAVTYVDNQAAAAYVRNILESIENVVSVPSDVNNVGMPGELLTQNYTLNAGIDYLPNQTNPDVFAANAAFNGAVQDLIESTNTQTLESWGHSAGKVPTRSTPTGVTFTDGQAAGAGSYKTLNNTTLVYGANLNVRNTIAGDFNGDLERDANDIAGMVKMYAYDQGTVAGGRAAAATDAAFAGTAGSAGEMSPEIVGDFNGDGDFDRDDLRYAADGLIANSSGALDRKANFVAMEAAWEDLSGSANLFNVSKSTWANSSAGNFYNAGDARGDIVTGNTGTGASNDYLATARGSTILSGDGIIDAADVQYVYDQFMSLGDKAMNWDDLNDALRGDLSADITGDLVVDINDVIELIGGYSSAPTGVAFGILHAQPGDVNLDGFVDLADLTLWRSNVGVVNPTYLMGDTNFDGFVDLADLTSWRLTVGSTTHTPEPASAMLIVLGGGLLLRRRRRLA